MSGTERIAKTQTKIYLIAKKAEADKIKAAAAAVGKSVNAFCLQAITAQIDRDNAAADT